jgi:hypothetical protein
MGTARVALVSALLAVALMLGVAPSPAQAAGPPTTVELTQVGGFITTGLVPTLTFRVRVTPHLPPGTGPLWNSFVQFTAGGQELCTAQAANAYVDDVADCSLPFKAKGLGLAAILSMTAEAHLIHFSRGDSDEFVPISIPLKPFG